MEARIESSPSPAFPGAVKLIAGLFFTALGLILTADNLDLINADHYLRFWPVVLILIGAVKLLESGAMRIVGGILLLAGVGMLANELGWVAFTPFDLWPLVLIAIGIGLVGRSVGIVPESGSPNLAMFANRKVVETSRDFRGGRFAAVLGGYELDLSNAQIAQSPAIIDAFAFWGGIEIIVPDDWEIVGEVMPFMAGFDVKTAGGPSASGKRLIIRGTAVMAGIEVKSVRRMS